MLWDLSRGLSDMGTFWGFSPLYVTNPVTNPAHIWQIPPKNDKPQRVTNPAHIWQTPPIYDKPPHIWQIPRIYDKPCPHVWQIPSTYDKAPHVTNPTHIWQTPPIYDKPQWQIPKKWQNPWLIPQSPRCDKPRPYMTNPNDKTQWHIPKKWENPWLIRSSSQMCHHLSKAR